MTRVRHPVRRRIAFAPFRLAERRIEASRAAFDAAREDQGTPKLEVG